eukprot:TRINITY_DN38008_c0_g1_i1.p1 TRINITY_DN38008_c0_g1~~TRINITY_DN38008_c0_g1_i1.p1  ORF type:complete len:320 (+),score=38.18 TRINITY_DN38008_c0_g1_i1:94-960(+)
MRRPEGPAVPERTDLDTINRVSLFLRGFLDAMERGAVSEYFDRWMHEEVTWVTAPELGIGVSAEGKEGACKLYNVILEKVFGGQKGLVEFELQDIAQTARDEVTVDFSISVPGVKHHRRWIIGLKEGLIHSILAKENVVGGIRGPSTIGSSSNDAGERLDLDGNASDDDDRDPPPLLPTSDIDVHDISIPPLPPPTLGRPCDHNQWDSVRVKRNHALLRCRECSAQWKLPADDIQKCPNFAANSCANGPQCEMLHVYTRKQNKAQRHASLIANEINKRKAHLVANAGL